MKHPHYFPIVYFSMVNQHQTSLLITFLNVISKVSNIPIFNCRALIYLNYLNMDYYFFVHFFVF